MNSNSVTPNSDPFYMPPETMKTTVSKYQTCKPEVIHRSQITEAPYNPRVIGENERKKLKAKIKQVGLVETLVWNRQTGHLVSGHQRMSILDELHKGKDYSLAMSVIDVPLDEEKRLNVFLNNPKAQGDWDVPGIENLIRDLGMSFDGMGFDAADIQLMCEAPDIATMFAREPLESTIEDIQGMKERKKAAKEKGREADDAENYFIITFNSRSDADAFLAGVGQTTESRYVNGHAVAARLGIALPSDAGLDNGAENVA